MVKALENLLIEVERWNDQALANGAASRPYDREAIDLASMVGWCNSQMDGPGAAEILLKGVSIGSLRYAKAALKLLLAQKEGERDSKRRQGWPDGVVRAIDQGIGDVRILQRQITYEPSDILSEINPQTGPQSLHEGQRPAEWDVFISHASEDKDQLARPLAQAQEVAEWKAITLPADAYAERLGWR